MLNNVKTLYNGVTYDSKAEARYAQFLDKLKSEGKIVSWRRQVPFAVYDDTGSYKMIVDFLVIYSNRQEIHEVKKGYYSPEFKYKLRLFYITYPHYSYYVTEEDRHNIWTYKTPQEFLHLYEPKDEPKEPTQVKLAPVKQYSWLEILLSGAFHHFVKLFVK